MLIGRQYYNLSLIRSEDGDPLEVALDNFKFKVVCERGK
jgi:hypothetical protein